MSEAKKKSDAAVEEMFLKQGIYKPLHIHTKHEPAGHYEKRKRSKDENDEPLYLDKSKPGGRFIVDGQLVNAKGDFIDEAGNVIACRLPENKPIKRFIVSKHKPFRKVETKETVKIIDGHRLKNSEDFLVEKKWINTESATKEANKILLEIESKYLPEIQKTKSDKTIKAINEKIEKEYKKRLHIWLYPEETTKGRPLGTLNNDSKINPENLKNAVLEINGEKDNVTQRDVREFMKRKHTTEFSNKTLSRFTEDRFGVKWKVFCKKVIDGELEK